MRVSRPGPKRGRRRRRFGLSVFLLAMMPTTIGYQDLAALIARQPAVSERWRQHTYPPTFATFRTATFSFPRPVGTLIPSLPGYTFASLDPRSIDVTGSIGRAGRMDPFAEPTPHIAFPQVDRTRKGDLLAPRRPAQPPEPQIAPAKHPVMPPKAPKVREALPKEPPPVAAPAVADADLRRSRSPEVGIRTAPERPAIAAAWPDREPRRFAPIEAPDAGPEKIAERAIELPLINFAGENPSGPAAESIPVETPVASWPDREPRAFAKIDVAAETTRVDVAGADYENPSGPVAAESVLASADLAPPDQIALDHPETSDGEPVKDENGGILTDDEPQDSEIVLSPQIAPENPAVEMAKLYFGADTLAPNETGLKPWREGEAPVLIPLHPSVDPDIKRAALDPSPKTDAPKADAKAHGETVAPKGEVTGADKRPKTPAERLGLEGAQRAKHERCLTNAIYFEARGEPERGQMAVAQVVLNRAFSGYYPDNICGVVYQNSHRKLACQFTFACDNVRDVVTEPDAWETAKRIARDTLDGKIWLPDIGKATHYHATYVHPWWVRTMKKHKTLGIHIFYRPTRWGDGADEWSWKPSAEMVTGSVGKSASRKPSIAESRM